MTPTNEDVYHAQQKIDEAALMLKHTLRYQDSQPDRQVYLRLAHDALTAATRYLNTTLNK